MRKKLYIFGIIIVCNSFYSFAQEPASMKWKQVNTSVFQLVFPEHYDSVARRIGTMLMIENPFETHSMQCVPKKITVILHNQSNMSNSWVALGPRRVELFHTPPQTTISPMDWNGALVLHEFRHVIQYQMLKKGFAGKLLYIYMGDIGLGLKSLTSPEWFYEGDAVATETALSYAGRGRSPDFSKDLRAQLLDKRKYSYAKAVCGSYKDYVPNHYVLGYHLVSYGRSVWSADLWRTAHKNSGNVIGLTPFSTGIKKVTGMRKYAFYNTALADLKTYWGNQLQRQKAFPFETITIPQKTTYTDYTYPQKLADKSIIALKSGMGDIPTIVKISPEGDETVIREVATITDGILNQKLPWPLRGLGSLIAVVINIALMDIIFSLDSVITAVGMASQLAVMSTAVVLAVAVMMFFAGAVSTFVERHPTIKVLALSFLLLIGVSLIADGLSFHIPKGYIYFAMAFSVFVEMTNLKVRKGSAPPVKLRQQLVGDINELD